MAEEPGNTEEKQFSIDRAKQGRAACKKCKEKCAVGELRIAKIVASPFGDGKMKNWHHLDCIFEQFLKQRVTTKRIESCFDIDGWDDLNDEDKRDVERRIDESQKNISEKYGIKITPKKEVKIVKNTESVNNSQQITDLSYLHKDVLFREFRRLVANISNVSSYTEKTKVVQEQFKKGSDGKGFKGNINQWTRLLLPGVIKRVYNLQSRQLIKLFSRIFRTDQDEMLESLQQGDIGETIQHFFEVSKHFKPNKKSLLTVQEVDDFLEELSKLTKEEDQVDHFTRMASKCTANDLKTIIRLIKHDLRMNAGAKHILQAIHPDAYAAYQASRDLTSVIGRCLGETSENARVQASVRVMTPIQPMLAEPCKSIEQAMKKCPNGMYAEIKYDGERVQVHKNGNEFKYFSRSLKPVLPHKVSHFKEFIPKAFPNANEIILDSEILMVDTVSGNPLPFGTLGVHKKSEFKDAYVCLFVFDCIYYNGESLVTKPIDYRKRILKETMVEIPNRIKFSEMEIIHQPKDLAKMIVKVLQLGLEGLVLKDLKSVYEPGKRHWLKVKKDYLNDGAMADTADLIVLGAWYGTGKKAGMKSVFLMGCYDSDTDRFYTVTKVHTGHDDKTLERLQDALKMVEIRSDPLKVPGWLKCTKAMIPDFVAEQPRKQPVWEITGAEFTQHDVHTADGISIRFPRVTKIRDDKDWSSATSLKELKSLFKKSKELTDIKLLLGVDDDVDEPPDSSSKAVVRKRKRDADDLLQPKSLKMEEDEEEESDPSYKIKNPFRDIFLNVNLLVEINLQKQLKDTLRYFIAYGGNLLKLDRCEDATHVLHLNSSIKQQATNCPKSARHVSVDWIKSCVANGCLQDYRAYSVEWEPL